MQIRFISSTYAKKSIHFQILSYSVKKYNKSAVNHAGDDEDIANPKPPAHPPQVAESPGSPKLSLAAQKYAASYAFNR